jgi:hypothetical protein
MADASWERMARFYFAGMVVLEQPMGTFLRFNLFDAIHRPGQLSAYLQAMGGSVPPIYEPAADETYRHA